MTASSATATALTTTGRIGVNMAAPTADLDVSGGSRMTASSATATALTTTGRVGVNTATPTATLDVSGSANVSNNLSVGRGGVGIGVTTSNIPNAFYVRVGTSNWRDYIPLLVADSSTNLQSWGGPDAQWFEWEYGNFIKDQYSYFAAYWLNANRAVVGTQFQVESFASNPPSSRGIFTFTATTVTNGIVTGYTGQLSAWNTTIYTLVAQQDGIDAGVARRSLSNRTLLMGGSVETGYLAVVGNLNLSGVARMAAASATATALTTTGRIGVNTATPTADLDVSGNARISGDFNVSDTLNLTQTRVAMGKGAGATSQGVRSVAIGISAGNIGQLTDSVAIGNTAGQTNQAQTCVAIGFEAGFSGQSTNSVAIGPSAGKTSQQTNSVAIGGAAGSDSQGSSSVAIGMLSGVTRQRASSVAIGTFAGNTDQSGNSVAIGSTAGQTTQGANSVAIGNEAGKTTQATGAVAIGIGAGTNSQRQNSVAIGANAGNSGQLDSAVAIGNEAGKTTQGTLSVAIGYLAGQTNQKTRSVAIGTSAGGSTQGEYSVAVGDNAGAIGQGAGCVAIGANAGFGSTTGQGANAIAIGNNAGVASQTAGSICLNASGVALNPNQAGLFIDPIRNVSTTNVVRYNASTREVSYFDESSLFGTPITFQPSLTDSGGTSLDTGNYNIRTGFYIKIGRMVCYQATISIKNGITSLNSANTLRLTLPVVSLISLSQSFTVGRMSGLGVSLVQVGAVIEPGTSFMTFTYRASQSASDTPMLCNAIAVGTTISVGGSYISNS
jgi:hypothetical protein